MQHLIQIRYGAEYPIYCDGKKHYYIRCNESFEDCDNAHPKEEE